MQGEANVTGEFEQQMKIPLRNQDLACLRVKHETVTKRHQSLIEILNRQTLNSRKFFYAVNISNENKMKQDKDRNIFDPTCTEPVRMKPST